MTLKRITAWVKKLLNKDVQKNEVETQQDLLAFVLESGSELTREMDKKYPPEFEGLPVIDPDELIKQNAKLVKEIFRYAPAEGSDVKEKYFEDYYLSVIRNVAKATQLLPASENYHHYGVGGLFQHSLQVGLFSLRMSMGKEPPKKDFVDVEYRKRIKYRYASFLAGLFHDIGKISTLYVLHDENGNVWNGITETPYDWAQENNSKRLFITWNRNRVYEHHKVSVFNWVWRLLPTEVEDSLKGDGNWIQEITTAAAGYAHDNSFLGNIVREADSESTRLDFKYMIDKYVGEKEQSLTSVILSTLVRLANQEWMSNGVNKSKSEIMVIGDQVYLKWPQAMERIIVAVNKNGGKLPASPTDAILLLEDRNIFVKPDDLPVHIFQKEGTSSFTKLLKLNHPSLIFGDAILPEGAKGHFIDDKGNPIPKTEEELALENESENQTQTEPEEWDVKSGEEFLSTVLSDIEQETRQMEERVTGVKTKLENESTLTKEERLAEDFRFNAEKWKIPSKYVPEIVSVFIEKYDALEAMSPKALQEWKLEAEEKSIYAMDYLQAHFSGKKVEDDVIVHKGGRHLIRVPTLFNRMKKKEGEVVPSMEEAGIIDSPKKLKISIQNREKHTTEKKTFIQLGLKANFILLSFGGADHEELHEMLYHITKTDAEVILAELQQGDAKTRTAKAEKPKRKPKKKKSDPAWSDESTEAGGIKIPKINVKKKAEESNSAVVEIEEAPVEVEPSSVQDLEPEEKGGKKSAKENKAEPEVYFEEVEEVFAPEVHDGHEEEVFAPDIHFQAPSESVEEKEPEKKQVKKAVEENKTEADVAEEVQEPAAPLPPPEKPIPISEEENKKDELLEQESEASVPTVQGSAPISLAEKIKSSQEKKAQEEGGTPAALAALLQKRSQETQKPKEETKRPVAPKKPAPSKPKSSPVKLVEEKPVSKPENQSAQDKEMSSETGTEAQPAPRKSSGTRSASAAQKNEKRRTRANSELLRKSDKVKQKVTEKPVVKQVGNLKWVDNSKVPTREASQDKISGLVMYLAEEKYDGFKAFIKELYDKTTHGEIDEGIELVNGVYLSIPGNVGRRSDYSIIFKGFNMLYKEKTGESVKVPHRVLVDVRLIPLEIED